VAAWAIFDLARPRLTPYPTSTAGVVELVDTRDLKREIAKNASDCTATKHDVHQGNTTFTYTHVLTPNCLDLALLWTLYGHRCIGACELAAVRQIESFLITQWVAGDLMRIAERGYDSKVISL